MVRCSTNHHFAYFPFLLLLLFPSQFNILITTPPSNFVGFRPNFRNTIPTQFDKLRRNFWNTIITQFDHFRMIPTEFLEYYYHPVRSIPSDSDGIFVLLFSCSSNNSVRFRRNFGIIIIIHFTHLRYHSSYVLSPA